MTNKKNDQLDIIMNKEVIIARNYREVVNEIRIGGNCNNCKKGVFEYDGMLNLVCSKCGYTAGGCFT
ncbi:MAG: hypothetical protein Q7U53_04235 [Anaerolineaceae bacterium]|nr:hypothetical protein [Anaerolineaceae bacterium]